MKSYEKIKEMLCEELETIAKKGELTAGSLDTVDKLTHAIKSLETIMAMNEYSEDGYSSRGSYDGNVNSNSYARRYTREGGNSYARYGNVRRDSMGRYSREGDDVVHSMRELMNRTSDPKAKDAIRQAMSEIERG
jgi:hypothetical protein